MERVPLPYPEILQVVRAQASPQNPIYLVGGAVRDLLLGRPVHDLDFALGENARSAAQRVANILGGAFFMLDEARGTARVI
jgi:tRNA nucleotidyltransferase/poly(A) polymerase